MDRYTTRARACTRTERERERQAEGERSKERKRKRDRHTITAHQSKASSPRLSLMSHTRMNHAPARSRVQRETERAQEWVRESKRKRESERGREREREREKYSTLEQSIDTETVSYVTHTNESCHTHEYQSHTKNAPCHTLGATHQKQVLPPRHIHMYVGIYVYIYVYIYMYIYIGSNKPEPTVITCRPSVFQSYTHSLTKSIIYIPGSLSSSTHPQTLSLTHHELSPLRTLISHTKSYDMYYLHITILYSHKLYPRLSQTVAPKNLSLTHTVPRPLLSTHHYHVLTTNSIIACHELSPSITLVSHTQSHDLYYLHVTNSTIFSPQALDHCVSQTDGPKNFSFTHTLSRPLESTYHELYFVLFKNSTIDSSQTVAGP